jgi:hypothetical protein
LQADNTTQISNINVDIIYPVGSIYLSVNGVDPHYLFGGQWEQTKSDLLLNINQPVYIWKRIK